MGEQMRAAKLIAASVEALLDAAAHIAGAGGLEHANRGYLTDCWSRVNYEIGAADNVSAVEELGDLVGDDGA